MKKFLIEREVAGAGNMTNEELQAMSKISVSVVAVLGKPYTWVESFVTKDKIYCIHEADSEDVIRQHANCSNFPANLIEEVRVIISPQTADK